MEDRIIKDETIIYHLYPEILETSSDSLYDVLTQLAVTYTHYIQKLTHDHIWYYEPIKLSVFIDTKGDIPAHIYGSTCYRDSIDDEWCIVRTLLLLTEQYHDLVISVDDIDGQFLLIEAAHCIPKWLTPDTATNRVFIHKDCIHIIPYPQTPAELTQFPAGTPGIVQSLRIVRGDLETQADQKIQETIKKRIESCKQKLHRAHCLLPVPAAHILLCHRDLISCIVHAFCDRDKEDMKAANRMFHFSPENHEAVMINVMFPRLLYAKLCREKWNLSRKTSSLHSSSASYNASILGMKVVCGLEILAHRYTHSTKEDIQSSDTRWSKFIASLHSRGYFKDEIEGSKLYNELLSSAKYYYTSVVMNETKDSSTVLETAGHLVLDLLKKGEWNEKDLQDRYLPPADDETWLNITPQHLDDMMSNYTGELKQTSSSSTALDLEDMVFGMKSFVNRVSSVEGAEFPWSSEGNTEVQFDPDEFLVTMETMLQKLSNTTIEEENSEDDLSEEEEEEEEEMVEMIQQMDEELSHSAIDRLNEGVMTNENLQPVDIDFNLVQNLLESYSGQEGLSGPASNILSTLGIELPQKDIT